MSRVAKNPVELPPGVSINLDANKITIKGSKGSLEQGLHKAVHIKQQDNFLYFEPQKNMENAAALAGTYRALVRNMVEGVNQGFTKVLQLVGVGYKAQASDKVLSLTLGHSHPINYKIPVGITIATPSQTEVAVSGIDKQLVGQVCADIISYRPPEPYKGKGVRYKGQQITLKEAKKK